MANPPRSNTIRQGDEDQRLREHNQFSRDVAYALEGRLTFGQNMYCDIRTVMVEVSALPIPFTTRFTTPPIGLLLLAFQEDDDNPMTLCNSFGPVQWRPSETLPGGVDIINIPGLTTGQRYKVTLLVVGG